MSAIVNQAGEFDIILTMSGLETACGAHIDCDTLSENGSSRAFITNPVVLIDNQFTSPEVDSVSITNPLVDGSIRLQKGQWNDPLAFYTPYKYSTDMADCPGGTPFTEPTPPVPCANEYIGEGTIDENGIVASPIEGDNLSACKNLWAYYSGWSAEFDPLFGFYSWEPAIYGTVRPFSTSSCSTPILGNFNVRLAAFAWPCLYELDESPWDDNGYFLCQLPPYAEIATADPVKCPGWSVLIQLHDVNTGTGRGGTLFYGTVALDDIPDEAGHSVSWAYSSAVNYAAPGFSSLTDNTIALRRTAAMLGNWGVGTVTIARATPENCNGS